MSSRRRTRVILFAVIWAYCVGASEIPFAAGRILDVEQSAMGCCKKYCRGQAEFAVVVSKDSSLGNEPAIVGTRLGYTAKEITSEVDIMMPMGRSSESVPCIYWVGGMCPTTRCALSLSPPMSPSGASFGTQFYAACHLCPGHAVESGWECAPDTPPFVRIHGQV